MPTATLTSKGQVTIPQEIRHKLGLKTGDRVNFEIQADGSVVLKTKKLPFESLRGIGKTNRRRPATLKEMDEAIARGATGRYLRAIGRGK